LEAQRPDEPHGARQRAPRIAGAGFEALLGRDADNQLHPVDTDDPTLSNPASSDADAASRMWMTALKMFRPIFTAVVSAPVEQLNTEGLIVTFFELLQATNRVAGRVADQLQANGRVDLNDPEHRWVLRRIIPHVAGCVAHQWKTHGAIDEQSLDGLYRGLLDSLDSGELTMPPGSVSLDGAIIEACGVEERFVRLTASEAANVSLMNAMEPLIAEISQFSCWQPPERLIGQLAAIVTENAEFLYHQQPEQMLSPRGRVVVLQTALKHAGQQVCESYRIHAQGLLQVADDIPESEWPAFQREHSSAQAGQRLCQHVADDARARCSLLHQAAQAGHQALDALLKKVAPPSPQQQATL